MAKGAPFLYCLPWQAGRTLAARYSSADVPRHYAGWVYAAVRAIAQGCAGCDVRFTITDDDVLNRRGRGARRELHRNGSSPSASSATSAVRSAVAPPHPLTRLFAEVNPFHTYRELVEITMTDLELSGNAYWVLSRTRVSDVPAEIWPVPPAWMRVVPDGTGGGSGGGDGLVRRYVFRRGGKETPLDARDVVHFRYTSPGDPYYGRSPLEAAMEAVKTDESVARAQRHAFDLGPVPGVVLKSRTPLTKDQQERLRADFESRFSGADAAGRLIITDPDADVVPFSSRPREMDFMDSGRAVRDRILGCFGVPPAVLGIVEDFNRANAEAAHMLFARSTLLPKLKLIAARITQDVCSQFAPDGIKCDFASPLPADREQDRREMSTAVRQGVLTPNEAREDYFGKPGVEGGDVPRPATAE
ncbi:MAG: phage portal protein [Planctomycetota bacterium]